MTKQSLADKIATRSTQVSRAKEMYHSVLKRERIVLWWVFPSDTRYTNSYYYHLDNASWKPL